MRVLILGCTGMLGHQLMRGLGMGFELVGTMRDSETPSGAPAWLRTARIMGGVCAEDFESVVRSVEDVRPDAVVNCIGIVKQSADAASPSAMITVNALFPHRLAELCDRSGSRLIHISTDCVFSGKLGRPCTEDDEPDPNDLYGRTKLLGEIGDSEHLTLRTSMIGPEIRGRLGLLEWFIRQRGGHAAGYAKALFSGLSTPALSAVMAGILKEHPRLRGLVHVAGEAISKFELLEKLNATYGLGVTLSRDETVECDRRLSALSLERQTGIRPRGWDAMLEELAVTCPIDIREGVEPC